MAGLKPATRTKRPRRTDSDSTPTLPAFRPPQLASLVKQVPQGDDWLFEVKYDGYRCQAAIAGDKVRLYTRRGHDWTDRFGYIVPALARLTKGSALIDGELCAIDQHGRSNFTLLENSLNGRTPVVFFAFDLLEQDGADLAPLPQIERKARLEALLAELPEEAPVHYSDHVIGRGDEVLAAMRAGGFEGVVAKAVNAPYRGGEDRSGAWLKIKSNQRQEFIIIGWRPPDYGPDDVRGLFLATEEDGQLVYRGAVGTGFTNRERSQVLELLKLIQADEPLPIVNMPRKEARACRWVQPRLLVEVEFTEITPDGQVRHPSYKGIRRDKLVADVHLEEAQHAQR